MNIRSLVVVASGVTLVSIGAAAMQAQQTTGAPAQGTAAADAQAPRTGVGNGQRPDDVFKQMVARLDLDHFKGTLKHLSEFGDRREGSQRNRNAVDWIEAQLKSFGCSNVTRMTYKLPPPRPANAAAPDDAAAAAGTGGNRGGAGAGAAGRGAAPTTNCSGRGATAPNGVPCGNSGASVSFGFRAPAGVNNDPMKQPDEAIRKLDMEPVDREQPVPEVFCTKIGTTHPEEMYILGGHMDGIGYGQAVNDDGSGAALVMEMARVFSAPDVTTERSIRFALWNGEEGGLHGAHAYVDQRKDLQGIEDPKGSGKYPEPKWLGMVQHDMMMWDHGMPAAVLNPDGSPKLNANGQPLYASPKEQRPEADVNIEFQSATKLADQSLKLAFFLKASNDKYSTDYPAQVGPHMTNTDSDPFMEICPAVSLRENERGAMVGAGWDPNWHQPTDVWTTYTDKDFKLGLASGQTTLSAVAQMVGATIKK